MQKKVTKKDGDNMPAPREWPTKADQTRMEVIAMNNRIARIVEDWAKDPNPDLRKTQRLIEILKLSKDAVTLLIQAKPSTGPLKLEE
jgi:hypothetical protein